MKQVCREVQDKCDADPGFAGEVALVIGQLEEIEVRIAQLNRRLARLVESPAQYQLAMLDKRLEDLELK